MLGGVMYIAHLRHQTDRADTTSGQSLPMAQEVARKENPRLSGGHARTNMSGSVEGMSAVGIRPLFALQLIVPSGRPRNIIYERI